MLLWILAGAGLLLGAASLVLVRGLGRRLDSLNQSYWELRYDYTRLRSQVTRLEPGEAAAPQAPVVPPPAPAPAPTVSFVPLSSMRKKEP